MPTDFVSDGKIGVDLTKIYQSASAASFEQLPWAPGTTVKTSGGGEYIFCRAESTVAQYDLVGFAAYADSATAATAVWTPRVAPVTTTTVASGGVAGATSKLGIAQVAITSAYYGWVAVAGVNLRVNSAAGCNPKVLLYTTATAGVLDDATISAAEIHGLTIITSATSASAPFCIANYPAIRLNATQG